MRYGFGLYFLLCPVSIYVVFCGGHAALYVCVCILLCIVCVMFLCLYNVRCMFDV